MVHGRVVTSRGTPASFASVLIRAADASCRPMEVSVGAVTDENGQYQGVVDVGVGPALSGCVVVEARSGGASGSASAPAWFTSSADLRQPVNVDITLSRPATLTLAEAERLVEWLASAINDRSGNVDPELGLYIADGAEALRVALEQYRTVLERVVEVRTLPRDWAPFPFELRGANGRSARVTVDQDDRTLLHGSLLDYGARSERFVNAYIRLIASGDAERLARLLSPDDIDFPVERAREIVVDHRLRYADTASIRAAFVGIDERRNTITWRLYGPARDGKEISEPLVLRFGDGLLGVVEPGEA